MKSRILVSIFLLANIFACEREYSNLGNQVQPASETFSLNFSDTLSFKAYTVTDSPISINNQPTNLLGSYYDPYYGTHSASFATQFRLAKTNTVFGSPDSIRIDSLILRMYYSTEYGYSDSLTPLVDQFVNVYELTNDLVFDETYNNSIDFSSYYNPAAVDTRFNLKPDSTGYFNIKLSNTLGRKLLFADDSVLIENSVFLPYFKGLYLKPEPVTTGGKIYYFNLETAESKLTLYYTNTVSLDKEEYSFVVNLLSSKLNLFEHDYSNATISGIDNLNQEDTVVYLQAMSGLRSKIEIPHLDDMLTYFDTTQSIINKAELVFTAKRDTIYPVNNQLLLYGINEDGSRQAIQEYISLTDAGAVYNATSYDSENAEYTFNIAPYLQDLIKGNITTQGFYLSPASSATSARRVIINSGSHPSPIKLKITYSKI